ncbi:PREDICTED: uncharacterized protein LOC109382248 [Hipposideros armiger]|uniref:Uncharacterized protein LOC109382248 n=1 Tax=Hipposideros armiger TaxID=186990 RepID=A0A8B7R7Z7_HIPAR|nr:PREDICTED: uncharacterized protein LOC109382248 [Hipposideros armiger]
MCADIILKGQRTHNPLAEPIQNELASTFRRHLLSPPTSCGSARGRAPWTTLGPAAACQLRSRPKFEKGENDAIDWRSPASQDWSPAEEEEEDDDDDDDVDGGAGGRDRRPSFARLAGASQPPPRARGLARVSSVPAAPAPVAPRAQPQMSSHNSRLAADSYKNCVWTISGEAPEFRAPVSCGVPLRSLKAPDQEISGAARPTASQTLSGRGPSRGKVDEQARGSRPCMGIPIAPGVCLLRLARGPQSSPRWVSAPPQVRGISSVRPGEPRLPSPRPQPGLPELARNPKSGGPRPGGVSEPGVRAAGRVGPPPPPSPRTHRLGRSPLPCG